MAQREDKARFRDSHVREIRQEMLRLRRDKEHLETL